MRNKSCFNCVNAVIMEDQSVGIYPHLEECNADNILVGSLFEKYCNNELDEETLAEECPCFSPHLIGKCANCNTYIGQPEYSWGLWVSGLYADPPVCSDKCKTELQAKEDKAIKEMKFHGW